MVPTKTFQFAFGLNKQSVIGTAIAAAKLAYMLPMEGFGPVELTFPDIVSDRNRFGKGDDFATFYDRIDRNLTLPQRSFSAAPISMLWIPAFVMGSVSSATTSAGSPNVYTHTFTFADKFTQQQCRYTSLIEKCSDYEELITGLVLNSFTLDFDKTRHVMISTQGMAKSRATSVITMPSVNVEACYFKALSATFKIGAPAGSVSINSTFLGGSMTISQAPEVKFMPGETVTGEPTYFLIGQQGVSGSVRVLMDTTRRNLFLNATECELIITLTGSLIRDTYYHQVVITIPHFQIVNGAQAEEGSETAINLTFDENSVLKASGAAYISVAVQGITAATDILVNG